MRSKPTMPVAENFFGKISAKQIENQTAKEQHHVDLVLFDNRPSAKNEYGDAEPGKNRIHGGELLEKTEDPDSTRQCRLRAAGWQPHELQTGNMAH